ncbi:ABC transporter permease [uncultured Shewanella sp.]|uniref:ABC transporter permease n=1 Tax=uncultured Shewanella sp. TaxID=173975 RepID=UPI00261F15A8|nr:ABC transporter permease [uncultured Shewanella sp.]
MAHYPSYYKMSQKLFFIILKLFSFLVLFFLILPLLIVIPLSFNAEPYFSFTQSMLNLDPQAYSLKWYQAFFTTPIWLTAIKNSLFVAVISTLLATVLGTLAALGLNANTMPFKRFIMALFLSPMIVPLIITAAGMFFFYAKFNLVGSYLGLILAHTSLGIPFVIITVCAALKSFDQSLYNAARLCGATPLKAFFTVTFVLIKPGVLSGALFAFVTSLDEIVLVLFLAGPEQRTIPRQMFSGLREQINPTILAVSSLLTLTTLLLLITILVVRHKEKAHVNHE